MTNIDVHRLTADFLGWSVESARSMSLQSLRENVRVQAPSTRQAEILQVLDKAIDDVGSETERAEIVAVTELEKELMRATVHGDLLRRRMARYAEQHPAEAKELEEVDQETNELMSDFQRSLTGALIDWRTMDDQNLLHDEAVRYAERVQCKIVEVVLKRSRALRHFNRWVMRDIDPSPVVR